MTINTDKLDQLNARLDLYLKAEQEALKAQSTSNAEGELTQFANLKTIRETIDDLNNQINNLTNPESTLTMFWEMPNV